MYNLNDWEGLRDDADAAEFDEWLRRYEKIRQFEKARPGVLDDESGQGSST